MALVLDDDLSNCTTHPLKKSEPIEIGKVFDGRFFLERELGRGGMGVVFATRLPNYPRPLAIKIVPFNDTSELSRLRREGAVLAELVGPHFVDILEIGVADSHAYVVMELLDGEDLKVRMARAGALSRSDLIRISREVSNALQFAHDLGYVHRDLKPANIFLEANAGRERVKLLDFGLAKHLTDDVRLTATGVLLGSPSFMSPEQIERPRDVDHRADLWSFCVVLYRLLTGASPFAGSGGRLLAAIQCSPHKPPTRVDARLPPELDAFFERGLAKDPRDRYQTASTVHAALLYALD